MDEYIVRSYIRKMAMLEMAYTMETETDAAVVLRMIDDAPAADVAPVVHGCFEPCFDENGNWRQGFAKCSNCGKEYYAQVINHFGYCPNCGAKMDGERKDGADG